MEYTPRFSQPFSLAEAINLDVAVITEEIARLQNSLAHLKESQTILQADLEGSEEADPEVAKAFKDNKSVIGSQEERISILNMALTEKGIVSGAHYEIAPASSRSDPHALPTGASDSSQSSANPDNRTTSAGEETEDNGVYL